MSKDPFVRLHAIVEGHVQGVGFRYFVLTHALQLDLTGWVRNTCDGEVEVMAEGLQSQLEILLDHLRNGPRSAFVTAVKTEWLPAENNFVDFKVARTNICEG